MKYEVSKELYEAVTGEDTGDIFEIYYKPRIDFDTFFFKCKEWALSQYEYDCIATRYIKGKQWECIIEDGYTSPIIAKADTEQQAVFDACEYIRKELLK